MSLGAITGKTIVASWPVHALRSNARVHFGTRARAVAKAREETTALCLERPRISRWPNAEIQIEYWPKDFRQDVQNVPASLKAHIDGIADAMGCDDRGFRVDYPSVFAGRDPAGKGKVIFHIREGKS